MQSQNSNNNTQTEDQSQLGTWLISVDSGRFGKPPVVRFRAKSLSKTPALQVGKALNLTFRLGQSDTWLVGALLAAHGFTEVSNSNNDFNLLWTGSHPRPHTFSSLRPFQRVNHFPRSYELTRKDRIYKNVARLQHCHGARHFDFLPPSFLMPGEYRDFWSAHHRLHGPWIVKPVASSRGRGIYLVSKPDEVPLEEPVLVSKYISNPLLVDGHKCDLRLYVAVTSYDPLVIYLYRHGLVRFAAVKYTADQDSLDNPCIHLCNYSINKYHADFVVSDDPSVEDVGHKRSLTGFLKCLRAQGKDVSLLMRRVEDVIIKAVMAATPPVAAACKMFVPHRNNCFELYGFDVLIDADLKPWLLEVNLSPSLGCDSSLDLRIKSALLADLLTLIGLPAVDPTSVPPGSANSGSTNRQGRARTAPMPEERNQFRRAQSADSQRNRIRPRVTPKISASASALTAEESRILQQLREEFDRRGDFNRIFPAEETWSTYGDFIDSLYTSLHATSTPAANFNRMVHEQLFPPHVPQTGQDRQNGDPSSSSSLSSSLSSSSSANNRLPPRAPSRRRLPGPGSGLMTGNVHHGCTTGQSQSRCVKSAFFRNQVMSGLHKNWRSLNEDSDTGEEIQKIHPPTFYEGAVLHHVTVESADAVNARERGMNLNGHLTDKKKIREQVQNLLQNQHILSQEQARRAFSRYLRYIVQRLPVLENSVESDHQLDLIERFLQRLGVSNRQRAASPAKQSPMKKLVGRDRVAVIASQLSEFLDRYERDLALPPNNQHHGECETQLRDYELVATDVFDSFLRVASEKDIEEILCQHTRIAPCSHFLSGRCHPRAASFTSVTAIRNDSMGLLREACSLANSNRSVSCNRSNARVIGKASAMTIIAAASDTSHHSQSPSSSSSSSVDPLGVVQTGRSAVVTFDLSCTNHRSNNGGNNRSHFPPHSSLRPAVPKGGGILKREESMTSVPE